MAETIKKGVIKKKTDENNSVILYPKTTADQIEYESKTYTGLYTSGSDNYKNANFYFINIKPDSWRDEWSVRYRLEFDPDSNVTISGSEYMHASYECFVAGARGVYSTYAMFNSINHTSYRPIGYHAIVETTEAGFNAGYGHKLGISFYYNGLAWNATNSSCKRTVKVTIIKAVNCTATFETAPLISHNSDRTDYTKLNSTYYPNSASESNIPGYLTVFNAYSNGLQETGDNDTISRLYYTDEYHDMSGSLGLCGYSLFGFDSNGKVQPISKYSASYTSYTTSISTDRVYNTGGFDIAKGLFRWNQSGYRAETLAAASNYIHYDKMINSFDFRYTDNVVNTASTNLTINGTKFIYLRGTIGSDGLFYLAPISVTYDNKTYKRVWTQDIPTTEDGYVYWLIGYPYAFIGYGYSIKLYEDNPLYWYKNGKFRAYNSQLIPIVDLTEL